VAKQVQQLAASPAIRQIQQMAEQVQKLARAPAVPVAYSRMQEVAEQVQKLAASPAMRQMQEMTAVLQPGGLVDFTTPAATEQARTQAFADAAKEPPPIAEREKAIPKLSLLRDHAPPDWKKRYPARQLTRAIERGLPVELVVLATDIRHSTFLMKEAIDPLRFASLLTEFIERSRVAVWDQGGWFDTFTGDGFIVYWPWRTERQYDAALLRCFQVVRRTFEDFYGRFVDLFMSNSKSLPAIGLRAGIDAGAAFLVSLTGKLSIIGDPVVGAVRMVGAARSTRTLLQAHVGQHVVARQNQGAFRDLVLTLMQISTKEYEGQFVYEVDVLGA